MEVLSGASYDDDGFPGFDQSGVLYESKPFQEGDTIYFTVGDTD